MARRDILWLILSLAFTGWSQPDLTAHLRTAKSGEYRVTYWTSEQGLPQNTVTCLLQSRNGYLWFGTRYGLVRYDGLRFTSYLTELAELDAQAANVSSLAEDTRGRLWMQSNSRLVLLEEGRFRLVSLEGTPFAGSLRCLCASRDGSLWVGRRRGIFQLAEGAVRREFSFRALTGSDRSEDVGEVQELFEDSQQRLWVSVYDSGVRQRTWHRIDPRSGASESLASVIHLSEPDIGALAEDERGRLWIERPGELLFWENGQLSRFAAAEPWGKTPTSRMTADRRGQVWLIAGPAGRLHRFADGRFTRYGMADGLSVDEDLRCVLPDREGNIWLGTGSGGLNRFQPRPMLAMLSDTRSMMDEVYSVTSAKGDRVWLATSYGLLKYEGGGFVAYTNPAARHPDGWFFKVRPALEDRSGIVWMGLDGTGLTALRDGKFERVDTPNLAGIGKRFVFSLLEDRSGTLWAATRRGLMQGREGRFRLWTTGDGLSDEFVFGLAEGPDGAIWAGTERGGVNRFKDGRFRTYTTRDGLLNNRAWPLRAEPDGSVWVGTPVGLNRIRGDQVRSVTMRQGLFDNLAYCLLEDQRGNYWAMCNRGLWRVGKRNLHTAADDPSSHVFCVSYGEADGMASQEGNGDQQPNAVALPNGEMWFPTTRGVVVVNPEKLRDNFVAPRMAIEEVRVDDQEVFRDGGYAPGATFQRARGGPRPAKAADASGRLWLAPGRARVLEIRYTANTFIDPEKARFRFRLDGHDADWREAGARRVAFYTSLHPGAYRFRVEACNRDGCWSEQPAEFRFLLAPHFYQTWTFWGLCALGAAGIGLALHLRRIRWRRRLQRVEQERALEEERGRIAKDLHDDLGANLTGMALEIELARRELGQPEALRDHLQALAGSMRGLVDRMRETVWTVNPKCDTIESFCSYVGQYAETYLAAAGLRCRLDLPEEVPARVLAAEARHHLLLAVKEALTNAVKHAGATEVRVAIKLTDGHLVVSVTDNGQGFASNKPVAAMPPQDAPACVGRGLAGSGQGLENMRQRLGALRGELILNDVNGAGAQVILRVPLAAVR